MNPWLLVAIGAFVSVTDLAIGLWLSRRGADATALYTDGNARLSAEGSRRAGKLIMLVSPVPVIALSVVAFTIFGEGAR